MNALPSGRFDMRRAAPPDIPAITSLMQRAIMQLQSGFLDARQVEASRAVMGLDTQLIEDGTYFLVFEQGTLAGCGGWSRRATLFGGDHSAGRDPAWLDPKTDAARIRAMYTDPGSIRRGVGRLILAVCEDDARQAGFRRTEMAATLAGEPLYRAAGYTLLERLSAGDDVPLLRMGKTL